VGVLTWEEIQKLSKGKIDEKIRAAELILSNSATGAKIQFPRESWEIVKSYAQAGQAEELRLGIARRLNGNVAWGLLHDLEATLLQDRSEVVREQVRIASEKRANEFNQTTLTRLSGKRTILERVRQSLPNFEAQIKTKYLEIMWQIKTRRLQLGVISAIALGVSAAYVVKGGVLTPGVLDALLQVNATIFALAFAIPFAAAQISPYRATRSLLADKKSLLFFATYFATVFLPIFVGASWSAVVVGMSVAAGALVFPI
jgi:hypothetical protein